MKIETLNKIEAMRDNAIEKYDNYIAQGEYENAEYWRGKKNAIDDILSLLNSDDKLMNDSINSLKNKFNSSKPSKIHI